ncbi:unnamed protein product [Trichobilharzia szidati]|nr:unnamed protein product [Trichobilharzia szidati]
MCKSWIYTMLLLYASGHITFHEILGSSLSFCSPPGKSCSVYRPCCGRDWVCNRGSSAEGTCVQCAQSNSPCQHANDCCRGVCVYGTCKLMGFLSEG